MTRVEIDTKRSVKTVKQTYTIVGISKEKTVQLNNTTIHSSATIDAEEEAIKKKKKMNLLTVRHRKSKRLATERETTIDSIYHSFVNTDRGGLEQYLI